ncbi:hypothetical protein OOU_Y34scaffold00552g117 [Pyricularia oryzae Y34]|uniref:Uncharacterized protein n=2 Tax=Pyricularia oryzae TaxID=318829 RepID=A0AA97PKM7_PYRO3|nr:hypothetical protein OOU_Y34scaffold00552g117 [Pyricularia oryzae Y34]
MPKRRILRISGSNPRITALKFALFPGSSPLKSNTRVYQVSARTILCLAYPSLTTLPQPLDRPTGYAGTLEYPG